MNILKSLLFSIIMMFPLIGIHADENQWLAFSMDLSNARYTPNKTVYETDGVYKNNWVKIELLTEEARKQDGCYSKICLLQYRSDFHEYRIVATQTFDKDGAVIDVLEDRYAQWHHVMPETITEWLANLAEELWNMQNK